MKKYYYHLCTNNHWQKGDEIEIGGEGYGVWNKVYNGQMIKNPAVKTNKDWLLHEYNFIIRELAAEEVRKNEFPNLPSRLRCLWLCENIEDCIARIPGFIQKGANVTQIVKVELDGNILVVNPDNYHTGEYSYLEYKENARKFWTDNEHKKNSVIMFAGKLKVVETIKV